MLDFLIDYIKNAPLKMISYAEYMEQALYHPEYGYYKKNKTKIGPEGDFITSSNISDIYGRTVAKWFYKEALNHRLPYQVCEIGGGNGRFAKAFIEEWNLISSDKLHYYILETSPYHRQLQREQISFSENIRQIESLNKISPFKGMIFLNELFDALPVHVIEKTREGLSEIMVTINEGQLTEIAVPLKDKAIKLYLEESGLVLSGRQRIEIPLNMEPMIKDIADTLDQGMVLTVDYGYTNEEWGEPARRDGSLRGYYRHMQFNNILERPGEMDITSHIHFDSLIRIGEKHGLQYVFKMRQDEFLLSAGILEDLESHNDPNPFSEKSKRNRAIRSLIMPSGISSAFHIALQYKRMNAK
ncbi:class I SAM-dependent methyltransferase [Cytobacillus sp. NCCP-133]|uniref:class I SAM-dependent methyltransferase n=1 Tax=Cytobacillus sp. NCCP-133 TaxID=766848 RepID=UPI0022315017|nr:SAM-dependent methyltransferase [Cytobacillus sp. NCCP-133]GLB58184.1 SAM-dependent methyltransferase [Cytobacillus sp. NCCP-133]